MMRALFSWDVLGLGLQVPMVHGDDHAMRLVVLSERNSAMRHLGHVHRVIVDWLHERLGKHPERDPTRPFCGAIRSISADMFSFARKVLLRPNLGEGRCVLSTFTPQKARWMNS